MVQGDRDSDLSQIAVNANNIPDDSVDCGIRALGWCRGANCQKYARLRTFVIVLACAGILQGAVETYFRVSAKQAALENGYNPLIVDWLLVSSGIFQAIFALGVAHWAHKLHPISWLGGIIMLQAATCIIVIIPSIINFSDGVVPLTHVDATDFCATSAVPLQRAILTVEQSQLAIIVLLFVLQLALGLGSLAFYTIGITYIDDNSKSLDSPAVIATALGAKIFGLQFGSSLILAVGATPLGWWLGWAIIAPLIFISGLLLSLFPKRLPKTVIHQAAQRIIEESRSRHFGSQFATYIDDTAFGASVKRLFGNKLLMFNLMGAMFVQAATLNYALQEESYLQSRFFLPYSEEDGLLQEWKARFVSYFLKPPVAAVSMLIGGLVISKLKLTGRKIATINIGLSVKLLAIYVAYIFIKCDVGPIAGISNGKLQQPYCSRQCICAPSTFLPVCPENSTVTYFSPCYAGCTRQTNINNIEFYEGCTCDAAMSAAQNMRATEGACSADKCAGMLIAFQILSVSAASILGMTTIGKIIITLRSVLPQDKALALGMEVMFVGLFAYIPVHLAYDLVTRVTCLYWAPHYSKCLLRETPKHGDILNILSAVLILISIVFDVLVFVYVKGLNLYNSKVTDLNYTPSLYSPIPREDADEGGSGGDDVRLPTIQSAVGGSPATAVTTASSPVQRQQSQPTRPAPNPEITVFRNPSSVTSGSSAGEQHSMDPNSGVTYAHVVFPPDKRKTADGSTSPKRYVPKADVPLHHLSSQDVRAQLGNLKSFNPESKKATEAPAAAVAETAVPVAPLTVDPAAAKAAETTDEDALRAQSPETDF